MRRWSTVAVGQLSVTGRGEHAAAVGALARHDVRATWFVLGWTAARFPDLVRAIYDGGHELATHGFWHRLVYRQTREEFADDLGRSLDALRAAAPNATVLGYRAPSFSITRDSQWALEVLAASGLKYDSSIVPIAGHDLYGMPDAPERPHRLESGLWEIPVSTVRRLGRTWPVGGGGYFRLLARTRSHAGPFVGCIARASRLPCTFIRGSSTPSNRASPCAAWKSALPSLSEPEKDRIAARTAARRIPFLAVPRCLPRPLAV